MNIHPSVVKSILTPSTSDRRPREHGTCWIRFESCSKSSAKVFDSSGESVLMFRLNHADVIRGWEIAVLSMQVGEKAVFEIKPDCAFGASGDGNVGPNETIVSTIELMRCDNRVDVSPKLDRTILSSLPRQSSGAKLFDSVQFDMTIVGENTLDIRSNVLCRIGCCDVWKAVEICLQCAEIDVETQFDIRVNDLVGPLLKGDNVPSTEWVTIKITLLSVTPFKRGDCLEERVAAAEELKRRGNVLYRNAFFDDASKHYIHALTVLEECKIENTLATSLRLNQAACALQTKDWGDVKKMCTRVLSDEPSNTKAMFRLAKMHFLRDEWDDARTYLHRLLKISANDEAASMLSKIDVLERRHTRKVRKQFGGFLSSGR